MKTAVEWLMEELPKHGSGAVRTFGYLFDKAKEMEKEQIIKATLYGFRQDSDGDDWEGDNYNAEKYYNQTLKQEQ
jgi:hypothetical protein